MPINDKDLGKYGRPDIYIEEVDASVTDLPFQDVLINLVPGFSKKGPVNRPVQITTKGDFIKIFGEIDKSLERKGSYFHRTCLKMLESSPIWALNLLSTDDDRDKLNWKAISLASQYDNASIKEMPYSKIFNRQDFWKRDTDAFLDYVTFDNSNAPDNNRLLYLTNVGDKVSTTFIYKSSAKGFDVTLEEWYGGVTKVPAYLHHKDWASDYLVTVVTLEGDWTNYNNLSVDTVWGKYFNNEGLIKSNITSFLNESNVKTLSYNDVSLIPYFKDQNGNVMYIKSVLNNNTDKTGIFCAMNEEYLMDSDIPTGSLDIIGSTLVNSDKSNINYLSYNENITENVTYHSVNLNTNGNVFGNKSALSDTYAPDRKMDKTDGYFEGINLTSTGSTLVQVNQIVHSAGTAPYWLDVALGSEGTVPNGFGPHTGLNVGDPITFTASFDNIVAYKTYYVVNTSQGDHMLQISEIKEGYPLVFTKAYIYSELSNAGLFLQKINIGTTITPTNYYNINGGKYTLDSGATFVNIEPLTLSINGTTVTPAERYDILYLSKGDNTVINTIKGSQAQSGASKPSFNFDIKDYIILGYVKLQTSTGVTPLVPSTNTAIAVTYYPVALTFGNSGNYTYFSDITITDGIVSGSNFIRFEFGGSSGTTDATNYEQTRIRGVYDALEAGLSQGKGVIINRITGKKLELNLSSMTFIDYGTTNNAVITIMIGTEVASQYYLGSDFLFYFIDNEFVMTVNTDRLLTSDMPVSALAGSGQTSGSNAGVIGKYSALYLDYYDGVINNWDTIFKYNIEGNPIKIFLKSWFKGSKLYVDFVSDTTGTSPLAIDNFVSNYNSELIIWSQKANYKQTVEIETVDISKGIDNVFEFSVDKTRYAEVTKGSLLEGYYTDEFGGTRKLVRVIKTTQDPINFNNKIVKTDGPIALTSFSGATVSDTEYSTMMYPSMDVYVNTYKGIKLTPFKIHADSIPNKTDIRQTEILEVLNINKNLAKGLVNKDKISWRYLIDSFGLGLTDRSKQQLVDLCGKKLNCLGFISMPSIKDFKKSDNPMFLDSDGLIDTGLIKVGGDESKSPSFLYTFGDGVGATCVGYFIPYVTINDDGVPMSFPPASYAATTYMKKFNTNQAGIEPWTICAGISNGQVIGVGDTEMDFNNDQLLDMAEMGANPLVKKKDVGICINTEYTAKRYPLSSLSIVHSRELLIDLENRLYDMLLRYQWKFNTAEIRAEIKYKADKICKDFQERDGIYDFQNIIDETNNTNYIIDLGRGVLDTKIEIIKGMGVIVNNITILKKGSIQSGGFQ